MQCVVITGASSGIGWAATRVCLEAGYRVIATARQHADLDRLQALGAEAVELDLENPQSVKQAVDAIRLLCGGELAALFNNAGYGLQVAMEDVSYDALSRQFEANVVGPVMFTNGLLACLNKGSKLVFNSSVMGIFVMPFRGPYCMSKFALEAAADAYRLELSGLGIDVHVIQPGPIEARFRANAYTQLQECLQGRSTRLDYSEHIDRLQAETLTEGTEPAEAVADLLLDILQGRKSKSRYLVTRVAKVGVFLKRLLGSRFDVIALRGQPVRDRSSSS